MTGDLYRIYLSSQRDGIDFNLACTRHVAIANWKRSGLSDAEIAALAGRSSSRTARKHYAGGRYGWTAEFACACPDLDLVAAIMAHNRVTMAFGYEATR